MPAGSAEWIASVSARHRTYGSTALGSVWPRILRSNVPGATVRDASEDDATACSAIYAPYVDRRLAEHHRGEQRAAAPGRLRGRTVASGATTVALKHGRLTVMFRLGPRTAAHALIRVSAKLDHELAVTSTLRRHAARRGS